MKNIYLFLVLPFLILLSACSPKIGAPMVGGVNYLPAESSADLVALSTNGYAAKEGAVMNDGIQRILNALIYQGVPNSPFRNPLLENQQLTETQQSYLNQIINGGYGNYINDAWFTQVPIKPKGSNAYSAPLQAVVNVAALKRDLRTQGIIPEFGL
jgi:hypothetical protein